jgi:hypothetical protein
MKLTTDICKGLIVKKVKLYIDKIGNEFVPPLNRNELMPACEVKCWKRMYKEHQDHTWTRAFDCKPYDDQLRAYVVSDDTDTEVLKVEIQTE